ncbi:MAG: hypothetical protein D3922_00880 [Candidatus Electrothrix sp. AR1]|nr:hypothetical protein [Candidatus Electrothrix sp. AR1]
MTSQQKSKCIDTIGHKKTKMSRKAFLFLKINKPNQPFFLFEYFSTGNPLKKPPIRLSLSRTQTIAA